MTSPSDLVAVGTAAVEAGRFDEAVRCFDEVVAQFGDAADGETRGWVAWALQCKGDAMRAAGRLEESLAVRDQLIARFGDDTGEYLRGCVSRAFERKARGLDALGRHEEELRVRDAELAWYAQGEPAGRPYARLHALVGRAGALDALGRYGDAAVAWGEVRACVGGTTDPDARWADAQALAARAGDLRELGEYRAALADLEYLQARFRRNENQYVAAALSRGIYEHGLVWQALDMPELARAAFESLTSEFASDSEPTTVDRVTRALFARAEDCAGRGELDAASELYDEVLARAHTSTDHRVWETAKRAAVSKTYLLANRSTLTRRWPILTAGSRRSRPGSPTIRASWRRCCTRE